MAAKSVLRGFSLALLAVSFAGCSHIAVVGFDRQANTVTVQGGKFDSEADIQKEAEKYCGGPVTLLGMGQGSAGTYTSYGNGMATSVPIRRWGYTYKCGG